MLLVRAGGSLSYWALNFPQETEHRKLSPQDAGSGCILVEDRTRRSRVGGGVDGLIASGHLPSMHRWGCVCPALQNGVHCHGQKIKV